MSRILKSLIFALPPLVGLVLPAAAQTTGTTSGVGGITLANPYGAVTLPTTTATTATVGPTTTAATGGSTTSGSARSAGSSGTGTTARSSSVPSWLLCPPTGAGGLAPFVTGTDLSCAP